MRRFIVTLNGKLLINDDDQFRFRAQRKHYSGCLENLLIHNCDVLDFAKDMWVALRDVSAKLPCVQGMCVKFRWASEKKLKRKFIRNMHDVVVDGYRYSQQYKWNGNNNKIPFICLTDSSDILIHHFGKRRGDLIDLHQFCSFVWVLVFGRCDAVYGWPWNYSIDEILVATGWPTSCVERHFSKSDLLRINDQHDMCRLTCPCIRSDGIAAGVTT